jgi:hypothetical protein
MWHRQRSGLYTKIVPLECRLHTRKMLNFYVPQLNTSEDPFHYALGSALSKINERKKVKYSIQHYCTAVANRRYCIDKN